MILLLYSFFDARSANSLFPQCPFHLLTKMYCPGCGSQRALSALLHGDFLQACRFNILAILAIPFLLYAAIVFCVNIFSNKRKIQLQFFYESWFSKTVLIVVIAFALVRNISVFPFTLLIP